ncbi:MAG: flavodoxin family protein [Muribaculaceae bacterium]|jgi:multimeric flavodoxin WrbA|nr:flavodoxin family protein [Muribaculaceae bacterium]
MKVLLVNGSPHNQGCTYTALSEIANTLNAEGIETEIFWIGIKPLSGCMGCGYCNREDKCVFNDSVNLFAEKAREADGFIFGSPVHYASAGGAISSFMDRLFYSSGDALAYKPAAGIVSCRRGGASTTFDQLNKYFTINCMPIVSSTYWNEVHGNKPEEVRQDLEGMQTMRTLGHNMAWLLHCIEAGKKAGITPATEPKVKTNFIR